MTENSLITLYCIVDDFIHSFLESSARKKISRFTMVDVTRNVECKLQMSWS